MLSQIDVVPKRDSDKARATAIAQALGLSNNNEEATIRLWVGEDGLSLQQGSQSPMCPDFSWSAVATKRQEGRRLGLVRACRPCAGMRLLDLTAGWGRDAAILASFGASVLMFERHPVMALLLEDALRRQDPLSRRRLNIALIKSDAQDWLNALENAEYPDVIFMDPMHPMRKKSAKVKKDLQVLQAMIGPDHDAASLLHLARSKVKKKLVLKWPSRAPSIASPDMSINGSTVRYDCFFI